MVAGIFDGGGEEARSGSPGVDGGRELFITNCFTVCIGGWSLQWGRSCAIASNACQDFCSARMSSGVCAVRMVSLFLFV